MRDVTEWKIAQDLSATGFDEMILDLGAGTYEREIFLIVSDGNWPEARSIREKYGCEVLVVPAEMLATPQTWGVQWGSQTVWSRGIE